MLEELERFVRHVRADIDGPTAEGRRRAARRLRDVVLATRGAKVSFDLQVVMWRASHVVENYRKSFNTDPDEAGRALDAALRWEFEDAVKTSRKGDTHLDVLFHRLRMSLGDKGRTFIRSHQAPTAAAYLLLRAGVLALRGRQEPLTHDEVLADPEGLKDRARDVRRARKALDSRS